MMHAVLRPSTHVHGPMLARGTTGRRQSAVTVGSSASSGSGFLAGPRPPHARPPTNLAIGGDNYKGIRTDYQDRIGAQDGAYEPPRESNLAATMPGGRRPGSSAGSVRSVRSSGAASSRPATALSVLRKGLVGPAAERRLEAKYNALWDAFSAQDVDESEHLHVEQLRQVLEYHGDAFGIGEAEIEELVSRCERHAGDRINYTQFITQMIKRDMPAPGAKPRGSRLRGELDQASATRGLQRAGASRDLYELRQLLHHPRFARQRALRDRFVEMDAAGDGRLPRADVIAETMDAGVSTISRYSLHRLVDQSNFRVGDESVDYNTFVLSMIRALRTAPASEADMRAATKNQPGRGAGGGGGAGGGAGGGQREREQRERERQQRHEQARGKLSRLRGYLALADERGLGRITPRQFAQVLALMGLATGEADARDLITQYLDKFSGRVNVAKFVEDIERGQFSLDGATLGGDAAGGALPALDLDAIARDPGVRVPRARHAKPDPMLPPHRVLAKPRPTNTPEHMGRFDDQDEIRTPRRHPCVRGGGTLFVCCLFFGFFAV
jgi:Ca2+-binding EF-hand superfamily protein